MQTVITFVTENWVSIIAIGTSALALFRTVAKVTHTQVDDKIAAALDEALAFVVASKK